MIHYSILLYHIISIFTYLTYSLTNHMPEICIGANIDILCHILIELVSIVWVVKKLALLYHCDKYRATTYVLKH